MLRRSVVVSPSRLTCDQDAFAPIMRERIKASRASSGRKPVLRTLDVASACESAPGFGRVCRCDLTPVPRHAIVYKGRRNPSESTFGICRVP
jgi:hypothetical protein